MDCSLPVSSVHGIFQARKLEWVAIYPLKGDLPTQGWIKPESSAAPAMAGRFFTTESLGKPHVYAQWNIIQPSNKKEILPFVTTRLNLEGIVLSKISPSQKDT